jgi:hypothetical protein
MLLATSGFCFGMRAVCELPVWSTCVPVSVLHLHNNLYSSKSPLADSFEPRLHSPTRYELRGWCCRFRLTLTAVAYLSETMASPVTFSLWAGAHGLCSLPKQTLKAT